MWDRGCRRLQVCSVLVAGLAWSWPAAAQVDPTVPPGQEGIVLPPAPQPAQPSGTISPGPIASTRLVVVNIKLLLEQSNAARSLEKQVAAQKEMLARDMTDQQERFGAAEQELARLRQTAVPDEFDRKRSEFENEVMATSRATQERTRRLDAAFNQARNQLLEALRDVVAQVATERGATMVISSQFVLYQIDRSVDITDAVMQRLNARLPEITVKLPQ